MEVSDQFASERSMYVSTAPQDSHSVETYIHLLEKNHMDVYFRDPSICAELNWITKIARSIYNSDTFLVFWSDHAIRSALQKFEIQTALVMGKSIFICLLDETRVPQPLVNLASFEADELVHDTEDIIDMLKQPHLTTTALPFDSIMHELHQIQATECHTVMNSAQNKYRELGWIA